MTQGTPLDIDIREKLQYILDDLQDYWMNEERWATPMRAGELTFSEQILALHRQQAYKELISLIGEDLLDFVPFEGSTGHLAPERVEERIWAINTFKTQLRQAAARLYGEDV